MAADRKYLMDSRSHKISQYSRENICVGVAGHIMLQAFNIYFEEHLPAAAS